MQSRAGESPVLPHVQPEPRRRCLGSGHFPVALEWTGDRMGEAYLGAGCWGQDLHSTETQTLGREQMRTLTVQ